MNATAVGSGGDLVVARNTAWNLVGEVGGVVSALIAVPIMVRSLGTQRFGVFMIALAVAGFLGILDVGLGRAVTKLTADRIALGRRSEAASMVVTASALMLAFGAVSGCGLAVIARWAAYHALKIPPALRAQTLSAFYLLAAAVPIIITASGFRGVLAAFQRFDLINLIRMPIGILLFAGPLIVLPFSHRLLYLVGALIAVRAVAWLAQLILCLKLLPELLTSRLDASLIKPLVSFGGWVTVSNVLGPLLTHADRVVIGAVVSMEAVAWYATPYEVAGRLWAIPSAVASAMFPAFAYRFARDEGRPIVLLGRGLTFIFLVMLPCVLVIITFAREGLTLWLGPVFAGHSYRVMQWLAIGVLLNGMAWAPYALVQAAHRPDLTAKVHLVETCIYLVVLWRMTEWMGIEGAAIARTLDAAADGVAFLFVAMAIFPTSKTIARNSLLGMVGAGVLAAIAAVLPQIPILKVGFLVAVFIGLSAGAWHFFGSEAMLDNLKRLLQSAEAPTPN